MQSVSPFEVNVPHFKFGDFSNLSSIASGGEGEVSRGTHNNLGNVAVKTLFRLLRIDELKELKILVGAKHPHIVQLFGILVSDHDLMKCSGYVMELMEFGNLNSVIHDPLIHYDMTQVYSWIEQAGRGLKYLHDREIIHRDIKPDNMLLASMNHLKIAGFGLAREIVIDGCITGGIGTFCYIAPEVIQSHRYAPAADVYAFIISIWEIVHRKMPYYDLERISMVTLLKEITVNGRRPIIKEGFKVDTEMKKLLQRGWDADPARRIKIDEIINYAKQKISQEDGKTGREIFNTMQILTLTAKLEEMEKRVMVMSLEMRESEEIKKTEMEQKLKIMEKALDDQRRNQENLGESTKNIQGYAQEKIAKLERTCGITEGIMRIMAAKIGETEKSLEEQRELNEKLSERLEWLEDKRTILMVRGTGNTTELLIFDRETSQWKTSSLQLPQAVGDCGMICLEQEIYIGGGDLWDQTFKLNKEMKWDRMADMNEERNGISSSVLLFDGCIWVFGGQDRSKEELNTVEKYIPSENKWIKIPPMDQKRRCAAAAVCGEKIYVCGGNFDDGDSFEVLKSVECFDPKEEIWTKFVDLPTPAYGMGVISDGGCLIIFGGVDVIALKTVWEINPDDADPTWKELPSMKERRRLLTVQSFGKKILAIGGKNACDGEKSVEIFNGTSWEYGPELPESCYGVASVVIPHSLTAKLLPM